MWSATADPWRLYVHSKPWDDHHRSDPPDGLQGHMKWLGLSVYLKQFGQIISVFWLKIDEWSYKIMLSMKTFCSIPKCMHIGRGERYLSLWRKKTTYWKCDDIGLLPPPCPEKTSLGVQPAANQNLLRPILWKPPHSQAGLAQRRYRLHFCCVLLSLIQLCLTMRKGYGILWEWEIYRTEFLFPKLCTAKNRYTPGHHACKS